MTETQCKRASANSASAGPERTGSGPAGWSAPAPTKRCWLSSCCGLLLVSLAAERPRSANALGHALCAVNSPLGPWAPCPSCIQARCQATCHSRRGYSPSVVCMPIVWDRGGPVLEDRKAVQSEVTEPHVPSVGPNSPVGWVPGFSSLDRWGN